MLHGICEAHVASEPVSSMLHCYSRVDAVVQQVRDRDFAGSLIDVRLIKVGAGLVDVASLSILIRPIEAPQFEVRCIRECTRQRATPVPTAEH